jgi:phosphotransacetylase
MIPEKDSDIGAISAIGAFAAPPPSKYERLLARAKEVPAATTVVVHPCDETSLRGPLEAAEAGIITPILVGPAAKIRTVAREHGLKLALRSSMLRIARRLRRKASSSSENPRANS